MDLSYSEEQTLLRDSVQKFIDDKYTISERNKITATDEGFSRDNWQLFAELGWLALPFSEDDGGIGGDALSDSQVVSGSPIEGDGVYTGILGDQDQGDAFLFTAPAYSPERWTHEGSWSRANLDAWLTRKGPEGSVVWSRP